MVTLTLSPIFNCGLTDGLGSGVAGAGVEAAGFALLFAFELFSVPAGSQAEIVSDKSITARSFFVMIVLHSYKRPPSRSVGFPFRWVNGNTKQNISCVK